uniref:Uncharacterized protein n=1 Tax=Maylandia zebra TaxID=106582 RepID=A0A3P9BJ90_9CICH
MCSYLDIMSLPPAAWFLCALIYPILKELRAERVTGEDGTEEKMLGFWSLLVLSPGMDFPTLQTVNIELISGNMTHSRVSVRKIAGSNIITTQSKDTPTAQICRTI